MRRTFFVTLLAAALVVSTAAQTVRITPAERRLAQAITADQLKNYLYFVASDAMEGRNTPSRGLDVTAEFLKMNLSRWGFKPAGDNGTYFQNIELISESIDVVNNILQIDGKDFALNADFLRFAGNGSANALMVFAGNGWMVKSKNIDAYKGVDVKGRIVVLKVDGAPSGMLTPMPSNVTEADLAGTQGTDWADPITYATIKGAAGILMVGTPQTSWGRTRQFLSRERLYPAKLQPVNSGSSPRLPIAVVSNAVSDVIFAATAGKDSTTAFNIDKTVSLTLMARMESKSTQNVVALWEGRDPVLKSEMVAIGAHYDHVGVNQNAPGDDKIWNGADDDGSGTVAVLSIAEALAKSKVRPRRSVLLVWHAGEEKGLWGAEYFNKYPTVDLKKVITQLNIDMIGRSLDPQNVIKCDQPGKPCNENLTKANEIYVIGSEMMSTTLGAITKRTNSAFLNLDYNYKYDDPKDKERFFFRSDHFHYAAKGIPIVFWFDGVHEDYHGPGDHADKIDYTKMEKVTRTIFLTMWELSEMTARPQVDKQLPPELTTK